MKNSCSLVYSHYAHFNKCYNKKFISNKIPTVPRFVFENKIKDYVRNNIIRIFNDIENNYYSLMDFSMFVLYSKIIHKG